MLRKILLITSGVIFALLLSQFLEFRQQYIQRISGALDELHHQIEALDGRAAEVDQTRMEYITHFLDSEDAAIHLEGQHLVDLLSRRVRITIALNKIKQAPAYQQLFVVFLHIDLPAAKATFADYQPAVPVNIPGILYALSGFLFGYLGMGALLTLFPRKILITEQ